MPDLMMECSGLWVWPLAIAFVFGFERVVRWMLERLVP